MGYSTKRLPYLSGVSAAAWFTAGGPPKEDLQLRVDQLHILATEVLSHKVPTLPHDMSQCL